MKLVRCSYYVFRDMSDIAHVLDSDGSGCFYGHALKSHRSIVWNPDGSISLHSHSGMDLVREASYSDFLAIGARTVDGRIPVQVDEAKPSPPDRRFYSRAELGREIANNWGWNLQASTSYDAIKSLSEEKSRDCVAAAQVQMLGQLLSEIKALPGRLAKAMETERNKHAKALEKQKQRTADKIRKAEEARPPVISVCVCPPEDIERAHSNGRVLRRF